jgi:hypothetical protein
MILKKYFKKDRPSADLSSPMWLGHKKSIGAWP